MNLRRMHQRYCTLAFAVLGAVGGLAAMSAANAADAKTDAASIQAQYERDVRACDTGHTNESKADCLREAGAAREEAQRKRLDDGQSANYQNNAIERCTSLPQPQRQDCLQQMEAPTKVEGSVGSGGVLRETVIQVPPGTPGSTTVPAGTPMPGAASPSGVPVTPGAATPAPVQ